MAQNTVIDSRGREVPLCSARSLPPGADPRTRSAVRAAETGGASFWRRAVLIGLVGSTPAAIVLVVTHVPIWTFLIVAVLFAGLEAFGMWFMRLGRAEGARDAMLVARLCPSCAYSLRAARAEPDSCTVCPECGGAWRLAPDVPA
jgi:hypothetical protein